LWSTQKLNLQGGNLWKESKVLVDNQYFNSLAEVNISFGMSRKSK